MKVKEKSSENSNSRGNIGRRKKILLRIYALSVILSIFGFAILNFLNLSLGLKVIKTTGELSRFSSYEELKVFLNNSRITNRSRGFYPTLSEDAGVFTKAPQASSVYEYSLTNVQVEGVDEADVVKCDGEYIYFASYERLIIIRAYPPERAKVLARVDFNGTIRGLLVKDDRLVVFEEFYDTFLYSKKDAKASPNVSTSISIVPPISWQAETRAWIYSIEDREKPNLLRVISVNGSYFTSRMIGDYVYLFVSQPTIVIEGEVMLPIISYDGNFERIEASQIYYSNASADYWYAFTTILCFSIRNLEPPEHEVLLLGTASAVYVSMENVYVAIPRMLGYGNSLGKVSDSESDGTEIHRLRIMDSGEIEYEASGVVPGHALNQFSMDEHNGYFRIATTVHSYSREEGFLSSNSLYVLDLSLSIVGRLEGLAPGETIYSARFLGNRGYLVTFKKVDPLFTIDLEDPRNPKALGALKISGYSDYLHPYGDGIILGIGKETVEAEASEDFAWYQGIKISIFDVRDIERPREIAKYEIGDRGTDSPILRDHKALLLDKRRGILILPILLAEIDEENYPKGVPPYAYGDYIWQGVYIFRIGESELDLVGRVTHLEALGSLEERYFVKRALYIDGTLYTISDGKLKVNDLNSLADIKELKL
ncbi:MAG: beta-propeller domain-containing protein [Candidatus Bathyarchaeia archaeon]